MAHGQALEAQRAPAFSFDPAELTLITDKADPLFDPRVERCAVPRERVLDVALRGVHTPVQVRRRGGDNVVIAGKQRTKAALVCNAIGAGVKYRGEVKAVHAAIKEFGADDDLVKKVTMFMKGKPLRIRAVAANSGDDSDARMLMRSENSQRLDDQKADRIRDVQEEIEKYGTPASLLAIAHGVSESTILAWSRKDLSAPPADRKPRTKSTKPSKSSVNDVVIALGDPKVGTLLCWVLGESTTEQVLEFYPELAEALGATKKAEAA